MLVKTLLIFFCAIVYTSVLQAQKERSDDSLSTTLSNKYLRQVENKISGLDRGIESKTIKLLKHLQKQESGIQNKLAKKDSVAAKQLFENKNVYQSLEQQIKNPLAKTGLKEYIPEFDSLKTSLAFLNKPGSLTSKLPNGIGNKLTTVNADIAGFENRFQKAEEIKQIIQERKQQIKEQLEKVGLAKDLKKMNKEVYYYQQQLTEYKSMLKDRKKIEQKAMSELTKLPAFASFMKKNSQLAQLFHLPDNYGTVESLALLQTRASVQGELQQRFGTAAFSSQGGGAGGYLQQQMQQAQGELTKLKDKINKAGGGSSDIDMPDFKPNTQKTKSFLKRIEYGANIQSQKTNAFLPVTSDIALTAGYKLSDKSVIGFGASYKMGWGNGWKNIKLTNEGVGLRSYSNVKLKGSIWISAGYEQNYQKSFANISQLKTLSYWQTSGLIGLSKKYKIGKKTNNLQLLWDFLSYQQIPRRQPILFRIGYVF